MRQRETVMDVRHIVLTFRLTHRVICRDAGRYLLLHLSQILRLHRLLLCLHGLLLCLLLSLCLHCYSLSLYLRLKSLQMLCIQSTTVGISAGLCLLCQQSRLIALLHRCVAVRVIRIARRRFRRCELFDVLAVHLILAGDSFDFGCCSFSCSFDLLVQSLFGVFV